jgi:outer membrane biosynthesis protein TonB
VTPAQKKKQRKKERKKERKKKRKEKKRKEKKRKEKKRKKERNDDTVFCILNSGSCPSWLYRGCVSYRYTHCAETHSTQEVKTAQHTRLKCLAQK